MLPPECLQIAQVSADTQAGWRLCQMLRQKTGLEMFHLREIFAALKKQAFSIAAQASPVRHG